MEHWLVSYSRAVAETHIEDITVHLLDDEEANALLNDLEHYPHAYVLACCMDKQISSEKAWYIPYAIKKLCGDFEIDTLAALDKEWYITQFNRHKLHRFPTDSAIAFHAAVMRIKGVYEGDASRIWSGKPSSAAVVRKFLEFEGVGVKIATMAANILARQYEIPFSDYSSIDISPDVHVMRIFTRAELIEAGASKDTAIYKARELCPEYPGIVDAACWNIGREFCHPHNPDCENCPVTNACPKRIEK